MVGLPGMDDTSRVVSCLLRIRSRCFVVLRDQETEVLDRPSGMGDTPWVVSCLLRIRSVWFSVVVGSRTLIGRALWCCPERG